MQSMLRDTARLGAEVVMYLDRLPFMAIATMGLFVAGFWSLAIFGAITLARALL